MYKKMNKKMNLYTVEFHKSKTDKRGESAWIRMVFNSNGQIFMTSEKYKNWRFAKAKAKQLAKELGNNFFIQHDHVKGILKPLTS